MGHLVKWNTGGYTGQLSSAVQARLQVRPRQMRRMTLMVPSDRMNLLRGWALELPRSGLARRIRTADPFVRRPSARRRARSAKRFETGRIFREQPLTNALAEFCAKRPGEPPRPTSTTPCPVTRECRHGRRLHGGGDPESFRQGSRLSRAVAGAKASAGLPRRTGIQTHAAESAFRTQAAVRRSATKEASRWALYLKESEAPLHHCPRAAAALANSNRPAG